LRKQAGWPRIGHFAGKLGWQPLRSAPSPQPFRRPLSILTITHPETRNFGRDQGMRKILP
jgi:hypothetical protein